MKLYCHNWRYCHDTLLFWQLCRMLLFFCLMWYMCYDVIEDLPEDQQMMASIKTKYLKYL